MANTIELITKYSTEAWDEVYKREAISSLLDAPSTQVKWTGAKTVKIAKFQAGGLKNYYRNNDGDPRVATGSPFGYGGSEVGLIWEEFTVKKDRGAKYPIELFDNEETDGLVLGAATKEISRTIMIPEIDAYCFSEVAAHAGKDLSSSVTTDPVELLNEGLLYLEENEVPAENQIIFVSPSFMNSLRNATKNISRLLQGDFDKDVKFRMTEYEGRKLVVVPPQRFQTDINLDGQGIAWGGNAKKIDFLICAKEAVLHVVKYNKVKIIQGDLNLAGQGFDGYTIFARVYHDVFVPDNKRFAIVLRAVNSGGFANTYELIVDYKTDSGHNYITYLNLQGAPEIKVRYVTSSASETVGSTAAGTLSAIGVGDQITLTDAGQSVTGTVIYVVDENDLVLAKKAF